MGGGALPGVSLVLGNLFGAATVAAAVVQDQRTEPSLSAPAPAPDPGYADPPDRAAP
ncbi:hypothetical protein [Streptomyces sp. NPDC048527]|uniref:hypothetical protein n=1 Tax=Streptomyces sp. NPDC048527 TaxID=3365568 RepID=UPI003719CCBE